MQPESMHTLASIARRLGALFCDSLIVFSVLLVMTVGLQALYFQIYQQPITGVAVWFRASLLLIWFGFISFFWIRSGQTLGMLAFRIRLVTREGNGISMKHALIRFFSAVLTAPFGGLCYLWCLFDAEGLSLQDRMSKTRVVKLPDLKK